MPYGPEEARQDAAKLSALVHSEGWKILDEEARKAQAVVLKRLARATPEEIVPLQARAQALEFLLEKPLELLRALVSATETPPAQDGDSN